ncbi:MAG: hypothetical protein ACXVCY_03135 [Pseudobdellovibrionaceae bacterium]
MDEFSVDTTIEELNTRWLGAREAAIKAVTHKIISEENYFKNLNAENPEIFEEVLKQTFLNSRKLGQSYQKKFSCSWEQSDFILYLERLAGHCFHGTWEKKNNSSTLIRKGCHPGKQYGPRFCQYWREAADGLIIGLSDQERFARHACVETADELCIDVVYSDEVIPTDKIWENPLRWGPLPQSMTQELGEIENRFREMKVHLSFLGLSEKNLFYKLEPKENITCGTSGVLYRNRLQELIKKSFPDLTLKDASPVAVYGEKT